MNKTVLITGATDGIGFETAKRLAEKSYTLLLHGRSKAKLRDVKKVLEASYPNVGISTLVADFTKLQEVVDLANCVKSRFRKIDVLINNAGVFKTSSPTSSEGYDVRFIVNTIAPYVLTKMLLPSIEQDGRIINLSSAAQAPVDLGALKGAHALSDSAAYAQSKLAITMWSVHLARSLGSNAPVVFAVNPGSFLGSKMVKEAYGSSGKDLSIGADLLCRATFDSAFSSAAGRYFDNDIGEFAHPHEDALDSVKNKALVLAIEGVINELGLSI
jgi:NAD(P)-dependent dehydrogenase (short-subunit alcohol dehydrogenase family)